MTEAEAKEVEEIERLNRYWIPRLIIFPIMYIASLAFLFYLGFAPEKWWVGLIHIAALLIAGTMLMMFPFYCKFLEETIRDTKYLKELKTKS